MSDSPRNPQNVHVHCTQCNSRLGASKNEWVHLTPCYARPKEKGTYTGCRIGTRSQVVPYGSAQQGAVGCGMVELLCGKCLSIVGQFCQTAPKGDQEHLLHLHFLKLSRIYLKDASAGRRAEPVFVDADSHNNQSRSGSVRSGVIHRAKTLSRNGATRSFRQSYPTPSSQTYSHDQRQPQHASMPPPSQYSHPPPALLQPFVHHYQPSTNCDDYLHYTLPQYTGTAEPFPPTSTDGLPNLQQEVNSHIAAIFQRLSHIAAAETRLASDEQRVTDAGTRSLDVTERLRRPEASEFDLRQRSNQSTGTSQLQNTACMQPQNTIMEQEEVIVGLAQQVASITKKLETLQNSINELEKQTEEIHSRPMPEFISQSKKYDFLDVFAVMLNAGLSAASKERGMKSFREEYNSTPARLRTVLSTTESVSDENTTRLGGISSRQDSQQLLGKRRRLVGAGEAKERKIARRWSDTDARDNQALPTSSSSQTEKQSLYRSKTFSRRLQHRATMHEQTHSQGSDVSSPMQKRSIVSVITDQGDTGTIAKQPGVAPDRNAFNRQFSSLRPHREPVPPADNLRFHDQTPSESVDLVETTRNSEAMEFSDEEDNIRIGVEVTHSQNKQTLCTASESGPQMPLINRVTATPTIQGLEQESFESPSFDRDHEQERCLDAAKGRIDPRRQFVLPDVAVAIHNSNDSATRCVTAASSQPPYNEISRGSEESQSATGVSFIRDAEKLDVAAQEQGSVVPNPQPGQRPSSSTADTLKPRPKALSPRRSRRCAMKRKETQEVPLPLATADADVIDSCAVCQRQGRMLCCNSCRRSYHRKCLDPPLNSRQKLQRNWFCPACSTQYTVDGYLEIKARDSVMMRPGRLTEENLARVKQSQDQVGEGN